MHNLHNLWQRIRQDIHRAPLWVWLGLAGTAVLIYLAWRNGGLSNLVPVTPTTPSVDTVDTSGQGSSPTDLPLPVPPSLLSGGTDGGGGGGTGSGGNGSAGASGNAIGGTIKSGGGVGGAIKSGGGVGGAIKSGGGVSGGYGHGVGQAINNPTAVSQREHRGLGTGLRPPGGAPTSQEMGQMLDGGAINQRLRGGRAAHRVSTGPAMLPHTPAHMTFEAKRPALAFLRSSRLQ